MWQAWRVSLEPVPAMTVVPSGRSAAASSMTRRCSSSDRVGASPVVPQTTKPSEPWRARCAMSSTNASSSTASRSSNGVTMAVMTDPRPGTGAIIPHVVEVEARDDVRVVVQDGPWPVDPALRAGGAAHLAALRRRVPAMHDGPVLAMTAVRGAVVHARRAGYFDMVATADALADDVALRARAVEVAGSEPLRCGAGRVAAVGLSVAATLPDGRVLLGRRRAELPLDPGAWHVVPSGMLEPEPDPIGAAVVREALEELGVAADPSAVRTLGLGWDLARLRPEVCVALALEAVPARAGGDEFDAVEAFEIARPPTPLTAGAACALALLAQR